MKSVSSGERVLSPFGIGHSAPGIRRAFSLAELMIALLILGLGLLFIAAALPVGIEYSRRNVAMTEAEAAGEEAMSTLQLALRTSDELYARNPNGTVRTPAVRVDAVHRPRGVRTEAGQPARFPFHPYYEPIIKVHAVAMRNVSVESGRSTTRGAHIVDDVEFAISQYLAAVPATTTSTWTPPNPALFPWPFGTKTPSGAGTYSLAGPLLEADVSSESPVPLVANPVVSALARVYPPVEPATLFRASEFLRNNVGGPYPQVGSRTVRDQLPAAEPLVNQRTVTGGGVAYRDLLKALDRRVAWTAFYRRISYPKWSDGTPANGWGNANDVPDILGIDPQLYELIVVVSQRPSVSHRYALQNLNGGKSAFSNPKAVKPRAASVVGGADRLCPTPWLVVMSSSSGSNPVFSPELTTSTSGRFGGGAVRLQYRNDVRTGERFLIPGQPTPSQIRIRCSPEVARLCPRGSILIPARNDYRPSGREAAGTLAKQQAGFVPSTFESLPIYKVLERESGADPESDDWTLIIENNGFYPWIGATGVGGGAALAQRMPFWVVPPPFETRGSDSEETPQYEDRSGILTVVRRIVSIPNVPDQYLP